MLDVSNKYDIVCEVESFDQLGEGPLYDDRSGRVWWVDIIGARLHRLDPETGEHFTLYQQDALTSLVKRESGGFVGTRTNEFVFLSEDGEELETLGAVEDGLPKNRFNDGKVDAKGRFWAGTMDNGLTEPTGSLYCLSDGTVSRKDTGYIVTNGPAFSPCGTIMYHTETIGGVIYRFIMADDGTIKDKTPFIEFPKEWGLPDGMTVDVDGNLWVGHYFGARITRFDTQGQKIEHIPMPANCITSCTFGGPGMDTLYVTSANDASLVGTSGHKKLDGCFFSLKTDTQGPVAPAYKG